MDGVRGRQCVPSMYYRRGQYLGRVSQSGSAGRRGSGTGETASAPGEGEGFPGVPSAFEEGHGCGCNGGGGGVEGELQELQLMSCQGIVRSIRIQVSNFKIFKFLFNAFIMYVQPIEPRLWAPVQSKLDLPKKRKRKKEK